MSIWSIVGRLFGSSRPLSWVNTAFPFGAAYLLVGGSVDVAFVVGCLFFLIPYNLLMYGINDVFDYESDVLNPRKGGVEGIVLDRQFHRITLWTSVMLCVPFVVALAWFGGLGSGMILAVSLFAVVAYSAPKLRFKERPFIDSLTSSTHFVSPAIFGWALALYRGAEGGPETLHIALAMVGFFAWGIGSHAFGAVQDINADREAGIGSIGTVLGARTTTRVALGAYLLAGLCLLMLPGLARLSALAVVPYIANVGPFVSLSDGEAERANAGWKRFLWLNFIAGFFLTQLMLVPLWT